MRLVALQATPIDPGGSGSIWFKLLLILIFVLINGFFSASEMAVVSLNDNKIRKEAEDGDRKAGRLLGFIDRQSKFLATIQVGVTLAGFLSAAFGAESIAPVLYAFLDPKGQMPWLATVSTVLVTIFISFASLVLGELVPKRIGMSRPQAFASAFGAILRFFELILSPFTKILNAATEAVSALLGLSEDQIGASVTEEEIRLLTEVGSKSGNIESVEATMINNVFELNDTEVSEIMTPRTQVSAMQKDSSWHEVVEMAAHGRFSRIPVYDDDMDDIIGILHIKDLLALKSADHASFVLANILRPAYYVPESKSVSALFTEMRQHHHSLAIVIDEYGGTDGIVSIEDVLEQIVGDIEDEYDIRIQPCIQDEDGSYIMDGRLTPEEAGAYIEALDVMEEDDAYDTMAGFVLSLLERIPEVDERPEVTFQNIRFAVMEMDDRRIAKIRITVLPKPIDEGDDDEEA